MLKVQQDQNITLNPGQIVANRFVSEVKQSDVEHGAYGGVVTDTEFDAPEDYEEERDQR